MSTAAYRPATGLQIDVEVRGDRVRKTFNRDIPGRAPADEKFEREYAAYCRFSELGTDFVPRLIECNRAGLWLDLERIANGRTLVDWLNDAAHNSFDPVITQLIHIDHYLHKHRINYLAGSPLDVLVAHDYRVYLIDFEYTWLDERFEDIFCESMNHTRLERVTNTSNRDLFIAMLASRRADIRHYSRRKITNAAVHRLRIGRRRKLVRR
ncbi:MAG: hypothetical protein GKS02_11495 [Alphaproteobacteria bacterium]|nr:hypothetical protein [Alphaproteobacteria bacterium]